VLSPEDEVVAAPETPELRHTNPDDAKQAARRRREAPPAHKHEKSKTAVVAATLNERQVISQLSHLAAVATARPVLQVAATNPADTDSAAYDRLQGGGGKRRLQQQKKECST
jgi:hypothetical protein